MKREREREKSVSIPWMLSPLPSIKSDKLLGELGRTRYNTVAEIRLLSGTATAAPPRFVSLRGHALRSITLSLSLSLSLSLFLSLSLSPIYLFNDGRCGDAISIPFSSVLPLNLAKKREKEKRREKIGFRKNLEWSVR